MKQLSMSKHHLEVVVKDHLPHPEEGATESSDLSIEHPTEVPSVGKSKTKSKQPRRGVLRAFSMDVVSVRSNQKINSLREETSSSTTTPQQESSQDQALESSPEVTTFLQKTKQRPTLNRGGAVQLPAGTAGHNAKRGSYLFETTKDLMAEYEKIAGDNNVVVTSSVKQQRRRASMITSQDFLLYDQIVA